MSNLSVKQYQNHRDSNHSMIDGFFFCQSGHAVYASSKLKPRLDVTGVSTFLSFPSIFSRELKKQTNFVKKSSKYLFVI